MEVQMRTQSLALKTTITNRDVEHVLALRRTYEAQKKRLEMAENALREVERDLMARIGAGATVLARHEIQVCPVERRNVAWKSICAELVGATATDAILAKTAPTISYRLLIKGEE